MRDGKLVIKKPSPNKNATLVNFIPPGQWMENAEEAVMTPSLSSTHHSSDLPFLILVFLYPIYDNSFYNIYKYKL
jgi:hypothetical protein